jgi:DeoR family transcriptional regulator, suf operon transcriptional repressor
VYSLTDEGMERFPTKLHAPDHANLSQMKETMPGPVVAQLFNQIAEEIAEQYTEDIKNLNMEERLDFVKELLARKALRSNGKRRMDSTRSTKSPARITRSASHTPKSARWTRP